MPNHNLLNQNKLHINGGRTSMEKLKKFIFILKDRQSFIID